MNNIANEIGDLFEGALNDETLAMVENIVSLVSIPPSLPTLLHPHTHPPTPSPHAALPLKERCAGAAKARIKQTEDTLLNKVPAFWKPWLAAPRRLFVSFGQSLAAGR